MQPFFTSELKNNQLFNSIWMTMFIMGLVLGAIAFVSRMDQDIRLILAIIAGVLIVFGLLLSQDRLIIKVEGNTLIIERTFLSRLKVKYYDIKKIEDLNYQQNVKSIVDTSNVKVRILGMVVTPENGKEYYYHKEILSFIYEGKRIKIGKWKKEFNGKALVNIIKERM